MRRAFRGSRTSGLIQGSFCRRLERASAVWSAVNVGAQNLSVKYGSTGGIIMIDTSKMKIKAVVILVVM